MALGSYLDIGRMDELARGETPVHRLDARAKLITTLIFIVTVMSYPRYEVSALVPLFVFPVAMVVAGNLPVLVLLRKLAVALPFALFVGMFNPLLDRHAGTVIGSQAISGGWLSFGSILLRFVLTVGAALVLIACTGIHRLCAGMERMGMPKVFAVQLLFLYRYFFVIGDEGQRMRRSVEIRGAGRPQAMGIRVYGHLIGALLLRAIDRARRIHGTMLARGFDGEIRLLESAMPGWRDAAFVLGWTVFFLAARVWNLSEVIGQWVTRGGA